MNFGEKSNESIKACATLIENELYNSSINRAYYGMFQYILHKLSIENELEKANKFSKESTFGTHAATINYYISNVLANNVKMKEKIRARNSANSLKDLRHKADYTIVEADSVIAKSAIRHCKEFIKIAK